MPWGLPGAGHPRVPGRYMGGAKEVPSVVLPREARRVPSVVPSGALGRESWRVPGVTAL